MKIGEFSQPIKVLLVEDSPTDVFLVRAALGLTHNAAFDLATVDRLQAAIAHVEAFAVDVILLDLGLPDAQGLETFTRAHAAMASVPIVVLSGLGDEQLAVQSVQLGAQDYLVKGIMMKELLPRAIRYAVERHRAKKKLKRYADELQEKNALLEEELRMAREVQQALLPHQYPHFSDTSGAYERGLQFAHRYCPAAALSGDFFHILPLSDHQAGVLVCDVMGHGVRAAFIGALARGFILHSAPLAHNPGEFLTGLNRELATTLKQMGIEAFASAFYVVADLAQRQISFANAGHPSALMLRRDAGAVDRLQVRRPFQPPLGLIAETTYQGSEATLEEHDSLVLFTDGLYEQENADGEQYGEERLIEAVSRRLGQPCGKLLDELVRETQRFSGRKDFADDVCLVGMDVTRGPAFDSRAA